MISFKGLVVIIFLRCLGFLKYKGINRREIKMLDLNVWLLLILLEVMIDLVVFKVNVKFGGYSEDLFLSFILE